MVIQLTSAAAKAKGLRIRIHSDSIGGAVLATITPASGQRAIKPRVQTHLGKALSGIHDIYLEVVGRAGSVDVSWFSFKLIPAKKK